MKYAVSDLPKKEISKIRERYANDELSRIDALTPYYRNVMNSLSPQKRKIVACLSRHGKPTRINELTLIARLGQQNKTSAQVSRLVKDGLLEKLPDRRYYINSKIPDFIKYLDMRLNRRFN